MNLTMEQFQKTITEINKLREKERLLAEQFKKSTGELSGVFCGIMQTVLDGHDSCYITIYACPEICAKKLKEMGFEITEYRDSDKILRGYGVSW